MNKFNRGPLVIFITITGLVHEDRKSFISTLMDSLKKIKKSHRIHVFDGGNVCDYILSRKRYGVKDMIILINRVNSIDSLCWWKWLVYRKTSSLNQRCCLISFSSIDTTREVSNKERLKINDLADLATSLSRPSKRRKNFVYSAFQYGSGEMAEEFENSLEAFIKYLKQL